MSRDEVLALLRERISANDIVDLVARRYPDIEPALQLVPLTLELAAERENALSRVATAIPGMTEQCRTVLRLRLQGMSFDQIGEEIGTDAIAAYARCRRRLFNSSNPLPEYAAGTLSEEERSMLFANATEG
jgi:hypothetical protein